MRRRCDRGSVEHGPSWSDRACYGALRTAGSGPHVTARRVRASLLPDKSCKGARCGVRQSRATLAVAAGGANRVVGTDQLEEMIDIA